MQPVISVIVPVYKVEAYLPKCVESILAQTYQNVEVILIDDGSPDRCPAICDEFAHRDSRIKVVHKENGGLSSARNTGIDIAKGDYFAFVDSDDYIAPNMYEFLYSRMSEKQADISICGRYVVFESGKAVTKSNKNVIRLVMNSEDAIRNMCTFRYFDTSCCDRLYKKTVFSSIRFPTGKLCEDWYTMYRIFDSAEIITYDSTPLYYYFQRENSISRSEKINAASIDASRQMLEFVEQKYPAVINEAASAFAFENIGVYNSYLKYHRKCDADFRSQIKHNVKCKIKYIVKNGSISTFKKMQAVIFCFSQPLYAGIFRLLKKANGAL